jgi:hypothetical protein
MLSTSYTSYTYVHPIARLHARPTAITPRMAGRQVCGWMARCAANGMCRQTRMNHAEHPLPGHPRGIFPAGSFYQPSTGGPAATNKPACWETARTTSSSTPRYHKPLHLFSQLSSSTSSLTSPPLSSSPLHSTTSSLACPPPLLLPSPSSSAPRCHKLCASTRAYRTRAAISPLCIMIQTAPLRAGHRVFATTQSTAIRYVACLLQRRVLQSGMSRVCYNAEYCNQVCRVFATTQSTAIRYAGMAS